MVTLTTPLVSPDLLPFVPAVPEDGQRFPSPEQIVSLFSKHHLTPDPKTYCEGDYACALGVLAYDTGLQGEVIADMGEDDGEYAAYKAGLVPLAARYGAPFLRGLDFGFTDAPSAGDDAAYWSRFSLACDDGWDWLFDSVNPHRTNEGSDADDFVSVFGWEPTDQDQADFELGIATGIAAYYQVLEAAML